MPTMKQIDDAFISETFMLFLRYRKSLDRFRSRPGVYRKPTTVGKAVGVAARELDLA